MTQQASGSVRMGGWVVHSVPADWNFIPEFGLRHKATEPPSNITVRDDTLLGGDKLAPYIQVQIDILKRTYKDPAFAGPQPSSLLRADESMLLLIRHQPLGTPPVLQVQTYVRLGLWIGIITLTTLEPFLPKVRAGYERFVSSLEIAPEQEKAFAPIPAGKQPMTR